MIKDLKKNIYLHILNRPDPENAEVIAHVSEAVDRFPKVCSFSEDYQKLYKQVVVGVIQKMLMDPVLNKLITKMSKDYQFLFEHSLLTSVWSMIIASGFSERHHKVNEEMVEVCIYGAILHDIGLTTFPDEVIYAEREFDLKHHPKLSLKMVESVSWLKDEVRFVILQHHESVNGSGYPDRMTNEMIFFPAKIVGLADAFVELIHKRNPDHALNARQAFAVLSRDGMKFDFTLLMILSDLIKKHEAPESSKIETDAIEEKSI